MKTKTNRNDKIIEMYKTTGKTLEEIGTEFDISKQRVNQILKKNDVDIVSAKDRRYKYKYSDQKILDFIINYYSECGEVPNAGEFQNLINGVGFATWPYFCDSFGSYTDLLAQAELPPPKQKNNSNKTYSDDEILDKLENLNYNTEGDKLSCSQFRDNRSDHDLPYLNVIIERFGSYNSALEKSGIKTSSSNFDYEKVKNHNDYNLMQKMYYETVKNNHYPTVKEWDEKFDIPAVTCRVRFSGWRNFQRKAMLEFSNTINGDNNE